MDNEKFTVEFGEVTNIGGGGASDFDELTNRPKYNDTTMSSDTNIPKVPSKTSDLTNDSDYQTETEVSDAISTAIGAINIPTKTSDLTNDGADGQSTYVETDELAAVATSGSYADLENKPSIPTVNDATLTITQNGISKGTFTANDADDTTIEVLDTTYSNFTGTDGTAAGAAGLVPAPATTDAGKFLKADGTWDTAGGGGGGGDTVYSDKNTSNSANGGAVYIGGKDASQQINLDPSSDNHRKYFWALPFNTSDTGQTVVPGEETVNIGAEQGGIYSDYNVSLGYRGRCSGNQNVNIGWQTTSNLAFDGHCVTIGGSAECDSGYGTALGSDAHVNQNHPGSVALGTDSRTTRAGEVYIGPNNTYFGYNNTKFRVIGGVHDGQLANDAVTVGQINALIDAINTAANTNISHIGS